MLLNNMVFIFGHIKDKEIIKLSYNYISKLINLEKLKLDLR